METFDLIVIGAGPGGYPAAIKAAKLGLKTAIIESREAGGTCLNRGCIPTKAMIHAAEVLESAKTGERFGILADNVRYDYGKILDYKNEVSAGLRQGVEQLLAANGVTVIKGLASIEKDKTVTVASGEERTCYGAEKILIATGSKPLVLPIEGMDLPGVMTSDDVFQMQDVPESMIIIGGGVISVEFATVFQALGAKVTIVEALPRILPGMDKEISQNLKMILKKRGVEIYTGAYVQKVEREGDGFACIFTEKEKEHRISADALLSAVGRAANTDGLLGEGTTLNIERGRILVDEEFRTSMDGVYAIGDVIPGIQLAHSASAQGIYVAERLAGKEPEVNLSIIPGCVYTSPEIAGVGITEEEAKEKGISVEIGKVMMSANGKSLISKEERGFIKILADAETKEIIGAQMMCARATDMIGEFVTAMANHMTAEDMRKGMRAHPTYNEAIGEALEEMAGGAIHVMPKKKR